MSAAQTKAARRRLRNDKRYKAARAAARAAQTRRAKGKTK